MKRDSARLLDAALGRHARVEVLRDAWISYLMHRLPLDEQDDAALAFAEDQDPREYEDSKR